MKKQGYTPEQIWDMFGGASIGPLIHRVNNAVRIILVKTFSKMPVEIVDWANDKLVFISSSEDYYAFALAKNTSWGGRKGFV